MSTERQFHLKPRWELEQEINRLHTVIYNLTQELDEAEENAYAMQQEIEKLKAQIK